MNHEVDNARMTSVAKKLVLTASLGLLLSLGLLRENYLHAQSAWPFAPPTTPMAQRNAMTLVINQVNLMQNAARTASSYTGGGGYGLLLQQFQSVRDQYNGFKSTLTPQQLSAGGNQLAELDDGLNIIQEAFNDYQTALANGQSQRTAFANLRQVLSEAMNVWVQEFRKDCRDLRVGW